MNSFWGTLKITLGIVFGFGILPALVPGWVDWEPPPPCESMRLSKQRRKTPLGYPHDQKKNVILNEILKNDKKRDLKNDSNQKHILMEVQGSKDLLPQELEELWAPTFSGWEKLQLFWYDSLGGMFVRNV